MEADIAAHVLDLEERLPWILQQMEETRAAQLPEAPAHGSLEREAIRVDYTFTLRKYLGDTASMSFHSNFSAAPSMQVSSFQGSSATNTTAFYTAPSRFIATSTIAPLAEHCTQLFIRNVPGYKLTMALQVGHMMA